MLLDNFEQTGCTLCYAGTYVSMAIDSADTAHAVFYNHSNVNWIGELVTDDAYENQYAYVNSGSSSAECTDGNWVSDFNETYVEADSSGTHNSVAIRPSDEMPCVAYKDADNNELMYACKDAGGCDAGWPAELVDTSGQVGEYASLAFNSLSEPYIAYYDYSNGNLKLAHYTNGAWDIQIVDSMFDVGNYVDLEIDADDVVHMIYYNNTQDIVKYAYGE